MRAYTLNILAETVRLAGELGARGVIISPGKASPLFAAPEEELFGYFFAALDQLCPIAAVERHRAVARERADHLDPDRRRPDGGAQALR